MRIDRLRFKNLNSLYGGYEIDFTDPAYLDSGIFAIVGRTGAGKSTILDAVTLSLYGQTPRLGAITGERNEIISRGSGECFAEVEFTCSKGRFRAHFSQKRATRAGARRGFSMYKQELFDLDRGDIVTARPVEFRRRIVELTGLNFEQFTKTMLLAQGRFNAFLGMNGEERAELLEELSGTGMYTEISRLVYERKKREAEKLAVLEQSMQSIVVLSDDDEQKLRGSLSSAESHALALSEKISRVQQQLAWLDELSAFERQLSDLAEAKRELAERCKMFAPEQGRLERGMAAQKLEAEYTRISLLKSQINSGRLGLAQARKELIAAEQACAIWKERQVAEEKVCRELETSWEAESKIIDRVKQIDRELLSTTARAGNWQAKKLALATELEDYNDELIAVKDSLNERRSGLDMAEKFISTHISEPELSELMTQAKLLDARLNSLAGESTKKVRSAADCRQSVEKLRLEREQQQLEADKISKQLTALQHLLSANDEKLTGLLAGRLDREYENELEHLQRELFLTAKIVNFEEERKRLADNVRCPLCGSLHHPFAAGGVPELEPIQQQINMLKEKLAKIRELRRAADDARMKLTGLLQQQAGIAARQRLLDDEIAEKDEMLTGITEELDELKSKAAVDEAGLLALAAGAGINAAGRDKVTVALSALRDELVKYRIEVEQLKGEIAGAETRRAVLTAAIAEKSRLRDEAAAAEQAELTELEQLQKQRVALYGEKSPESEAARFSARLLAVREECEKLSGLYFKSAGEVNMLTGRIGQLDRDLSDWLSELPGLEKSFQSAIAAGGFVSEDDFLHCRIAPDELDTLSRRKQALERESIELSGREKSTVAAYEVCSGKYPERPAREEVAAQLELAGDELNNTVAQSGALRQKLADNEASKDRFKSESEKLQTARSGYEKWRILDELIGGSDAKRFRNFVQGLTFDLLISHANRNLLRIAPRYLLQRVPDAVLELNVIDSEQGGEIRSVKTLSGGESFLVSLSLALGLSDMAGRNARIDSLFLDEGFGSLDEETLDSALTALTALARENKLIGVISHVGGLQERLSTAITVTQLGSGRSRLSGPGCRVLS